MVASREHDNIKNMLLPMASLFTSLGTLICCALPALFVTLGAGATLASLVSTAPWLATFSTYKVWTFSISGILIIIAGLTHWQSRNKPCPLDPKQAKACTQLRKLNFWVYTASLTIWIIGFFFAFVAVEIFY